MLPKTIQILDMNAVAERALQETLSRFDVAMKEPLPELPTRFPIQVGKQTRVFLEYHAQALRTSIAALAGSILDRVVEETLRNNGTECQPKRNLS